MDHPGGNGGGGGGGRSSSRLRDRLVRMFRPGSLLRSTCNNHATASTSSSAGGAVAAKAATTMTSCTAASACSSSRALLAADASAAVDRDSFFASSRRDYYAATAALVGRTESFSTALDRLHRRAATPLPPSRFSVDASPPLVEGKRKEEASREKERSAARDVQSYHYHHHHRRHGSLGGGGAKSDKTRRLLSNPYGFSTSDDADTDGEDVFSSDADDRGRAGAGGTKKGEAEAFFSSSRSFSSDSSEFYTKKKNKPKKKPPSTTVKPQPSPQPPRTSQQRRKRRAASSCDTCGVRDGFRPVVSAAEEQVRRGFAVVKRSRDPYTDFRASMVEMVVGRQMFGAAELERLLRSYLSLNAPRHHPVILQAFSDIWVVLHGG
ncbi:hypothetical protein E2562_017494 [Oryza meyeriana var. granulata]|uniref:Transcription repressor n=1 Tax=Oryza meyeriana var. granulata TaxID=110450 RepID=A0A6G1DXT8_9ORYZ|nr:hypothetical protein E2562_017494 [Oryza meyeriana var. granulata]